MNDSLNSVEDLPERESTSQRLSGDWELRARKGKELLNESTSEQLVESGINDGEDAVESGEDDTAQQTGERGCDTSQQTDDGVKDVVDETSNSDEHLIDRGENVGDDRRETRDQTREDLLEDRVEDHSDVDQHSEVDDGRVGVRDPSGSERRSEVRSSPDVEDSGSDGVDRTYRTEEAVERGDVSVGVGVDDRTERRVGRDDGVQPDDDVENVEEADTDGCVGRDGRAGGLTDQLGDGGSETEAGGVDRGVDVEESSEEELVDDG